MKAKVQAMFKVEMAALAKGTAGYATKSGQARTPKALLIFLATQLATPLEKIFDLCPFSPDWVADFCFDCLRDAWPDTMCFLFPPEKIAAAAVTRALLEWFNGKDVIFIGRELLLNRLFDLSVTRDIAIHAHLGSPIFEPHMHQADGTYGVYLFLQPTTMDRIQRFRKNYKNKKTWLYLPDSLTRWLNGMQEEDEEDIIARMHWHGAQNIEIEQTFNLYRLDLKKYKPRIQQYENLTRQQCPAAKNRRLDRR